jgi:hypothetical protein
VHPQFSYDFDVHSGRLRLVGALHHDADDISLRRVVLLAMRAVPRELVLDLSGVTSIWPSACQELVFLVAAAEHLDRSVRVVSGPETVGAWVLPPLGIPVQEVEGPPGAHTSRSERSLQIAGLDWA